MSRSKQYTKNRLRGKGKLSMFTWLRAEPRHSKMPGAIRNVYFRQMFTISGLVLHSEQYRIVLNGVCYDREVYNIRVYCSKHLLQ